MRYIDVQLPVRERRRIQNSTRERPLQATYKVRKMNGDKVKVCQKSFMSILCISRFRVNRLARANHDNGKRFVERRGGSRKTYSDEEVDASITEWIKNYKCRESHYGRGKSVRSYLPPTLTISKMWRSWKNARSENGEKLASISKFKKIFYSRFNLGFGNPRQDVCSFCEQLRMKIRIESDSTKLQQLITEFRLHKRKAKSFYSLMNESLPNTLTVCFDMQQNQPLPKLSVGEVFYSRQVWLYNLTIMKHEAEQKKENIHFYTWLETQAGRGANEISSAVMDYLTLLDKELYDSEALPTTLRLFSDACASQNKNTILINCIQYFLKTSRIIKSIIHYFPVRGHSYMPPDRVFGRMEKDFRNHEQILSPNGYYDILSKHGHNHKLGSDWSLRDFKTVSIGITKPRLPFKMNECRVFSYEKDSFSVQRSYFGLSSRVSIIKQGRSVSEIEKVRPKVLESHVKTAKKNDVIKLMKFFTIPSDSVSFYDSIIHDHSQTADETVDQYFIDEPYN